MALMTVLVWRGLDGISRVQTRLQQQADEVLTLQATLTQWGADLDAMTEQPDTPSLDWDGRVLRILRRDTAAPADGLRVVAWTRRITSTADGLTKIANGTTGSTSGGQWLRWQSPPLLTRGALDVAWQKAQVWAQSPSDEDRLLEVRTVAIDDWQIFYYRGNAWSNPLSSAGTQDGTPLSAIAAASAASMAGSSVTAASAAVSATSIGLASTPDGIRLLLRLSAGQAINGTITRDWVRGLIGGNK